MTFPRAERRSSMRWIFTASGRVLRRCWSSWSVVVVGTRRPFLFPTVKRPTMRVPAIVAWQIGMTSWSSDSKTLREVVSLAFWRVGLRGFRFALRCFGSEWWVGWVGRSEIKRLDCIRDIPPTLSQSRRVWVHPVESNPVRPVRPIQSDKSNPAQRSKSSAIQSR